jgi:tetratricopeptide (TPR) repeat protein
MAMEGMDGIEGREGRVYYDLGVFAFEDGDYKGALENFTMALNYEPNNSVYLHYLGKTFFKKDLLQEAEETLQKALNIDPDLPDLKYDLAHLYYKQTDYFKAANLFMDVSKEEPNNVLANYYAGISLYKIKDYKTAADYFISAADKSPTVKENGYYYAGICYYNSGNLDSALKKFEYLKNESENELLKQNSEKYIKNISIQKRINRPYSLYAKFSFQYDDNVMLDPLDQDLFTDEEDSLMEFYLSGTYDFIKKDTYKLGAGYSHYQTQYFDLTDYNLIGSTLNLYAKYKLSPFTLGFNILPAKYWVDNDKYLESLQFRPEISYEFNKRLKAFANYSYHIVNHLQNDDKDGYTHGVFVKMQYRLAGNFGFVFAGMGFDDFNADHPDEDYNRFKTSAGISIKGPLDIYISLTGQFDNKQYDNIDTFYAVERDDNKYFGAVSLTRNIIYDWLSISLEYNHTRNDSNISDFDYKKNVGKLILTVNL